VSSSLDLVSSHTELISLQQFISKGFNTFRINIMMERIVPNKLDGGLDAAYFKDLDDSIKYITNKKAYAMIVPHNYGRYYDKIVTDVSGMEKFWKTLATPYKDNQYVIFDTNNECKSAASTYIPPPPYPRLPAIMATSSTNFLQSTTWTNPSSFN
jgi:hypothetical protein